MNAPERKILRRLVALMDSASGYIDTTQERAEVDLITAESRKALEDDAVDVGAPDNDKIDSLVAQIELSALTARMNATMVGVEGMKADNADRLQNGHTIAHDSRDFAHETAILNSIAEEMRALARTGETP